METSRTNEIINVIAALGVIVGLAFVAYELRQTNKIAYENANSEISDKLMSFYAFLAEPGISEVLVKAQEGTSELTRVEASRFSQILASWVEVQYYGTVLQLSGRTDEDWLGHTERGAHAYFGNRHGRAWWDEAKIGYPRELVNAVERGLANSDSGKRLEFMDNVRFGRDGHSDGN